MPLRDDLLTPIPGDNPSGKNLRYDPETDKIKEARREELDLKQGDWKTTVKTADYPLVIKLCGEVLTKRSKDLQIAVWMIDALLKREGFSVLEPSFRFLQGLLAQFWDTLYPEIEDGDLEIRAAPLEWLGTKLEEPIRLAPLTANRLGWIAYQESRLVGYEEDANTDDKLEARNTRIKEGKVTPEQFDEAVAETPLNFYETADTALGDAAEALENLIAYCDTQFGDFSPNFLKLRSAIEDVQQTVRQLLTKKGGGSTGSERPEDEVIEIEESVSAQAEDEDLSDPPPRAAATASKPAQSFKADPNDVAQQLAAICAALREKDEQDVTPYMIIRAFRWGELWYHAPPVIYSRLEAPPSETRVELRKAFGNSDWDEVLTHTETAMALPCGRAWLDLQRYTIVALEQIGLESAAAAVKGGLRALLQDLPELLESNLMDDTPTANSETKAWIAASVLAPKKEPPVAPPEETSTDSTDDFSMSSDDSSMDFSSSSDDSTDFSASTSEEEPTPEPAVEAGPDPTFAGPIDENPPIIEKSEDVIVEEGPDVFEVAKQALQDGNAVEGLGLISKKLANERSGRGRFRRRTQLAHLLMLGGHPKVAQPLLIQLSGEIDERKLEEWEDTEALAYPLELLMRTLGSEEDHRERKMQLYERICKLDPLRAMNCSV